MKKRLFPNIPRFKRDEKKQYLRKYRFYPALMYSRLDRWLKEMSLSGWHIVDCGLFSFLFERGDAAEKEYFTYSCGASHRKEGYFSIPLRYPFLDRTYGMKRKKSKINANDAKAYQIVEIDMSVIVAEGADGYKELVRDRNRLYTLQAIRNAAIVLLMLAVGLLIIALARRTGG